MITTLIFDYFGVVRPQGHGLRSIYRALGGDTIKDEAFIADLTAAANYGFVDDYDEQLAARLGVSVEKWRQAVDNPAMHHDPDLLSYIKTLRKKGYKMGLLSNAGTGALPRYFGGESALAEYFDVALSSGDTDLVKPEAAAYRLMAEKLGVEPEVCVMIDDRYEFCEGARRVGMQAIEYTDFPHFKAAFESLVS